MTSESRHRTCIISTPGRNRGGTGARRAPDSGLGLNWHLPSFLCYPSTGSGPLTVSGGSRKVRNTS